ncbi:hypothetical protein Cpin_2113 [Chitinophaga pinensis DSM 2588]|uniref:Uncharacterized protein n=1 Tax=Chitinophaga pinensis (strain ATCC 43595 / DSM 2588 / LMG 13176 / NBRC 15968 / NCIMB 11800 / UQM 2034) TaxID=485918 RepID=A0A979G2I1_CHIPD|nr:hypothetical protein Cpin_2113 [Chitinophaga pinensis DSM 2588]
MTGYDPGYQQADLAEMSGQLAFYRSLGGGWK